MNATTMAEARRLDSFIGEVAGEGVPHDLADRVLLRVRALPPRRRRPGRLAAALVMLGGVAVVASVSALRRGADFVPTQEPATPERLATVTNAGVRPGPDQRFDLAKDSDAVTEILRIARQVGSPIVLTGGLTGKVAQDAKGLPWRTAVAELAARIGAGVGEYGPILVLAPRVKTLPYETPLTLVTKDVDVRAFAKTVAARTGVAIVLAGDVHGRVRCDLNQASWRDALGEVARQLGCVVEGCGAVLVLRRAPVAAAPTLRTHFEFVDLGLAEAVATIAKITSANVVVERMADVKVSVQGDEVSCGAVLAAIAAAVDTNFMGEAPNLFRLGGGNIAPKTATDVTAEDVDLRTFAELVRTATQINVPVPSDAKERLTVFAIAAPLADLLRAAALATGRRVVDEFDAALGRAALHVK